MEIGTHISIITLNVNGLNGPTKGHRLAEWIQNQEPNIIPTPAYNNVQIPPQQQENNNFVGLQTFNQQNTTIPQPINTIPTPQPVKPQPLMQNNIPEQQIVQPNFNNQGMQNGSMPQMVPQQPVNQPINFVYGPQSDNQNM